MENRVVDITLNKDEMKLWGSLALKGIDNAMTGLATMVNREIRMSSLSLKQVPASEAPNLVGGADKMVIGIYLAFEGDATGHLMLVHQPDVALAIIDMLMGNEPGTTRDINEMEQSALGEMGNIIGSAFLNAIADALALRLQPSPPEVILDMAGAILDVAFAEILQQTDDVIVAETSFGTSDRQARGTFLVIPSFNFLKVILSHAGVEK